MLNALTSNWFIFFPLALSLFVALRLAEGASDSGQRSLSLNFVRLFILSLFVFALLAIGLRGNPLGLIWLFLGSAFVVVLLWKRRRMERGAMLLTALQAHDQSQQFTVAESFWSENRGWVRRAAAGLREDLVLGTTWQQSLEKRKLAIGIYEKLASRLVATYGSQDRRASSTENAQASNQSARAEPVFDMQAPLAVETETELLLGRLLLFAWAIIGIPTAIVFIATILPTTVYLLQEFGQAEPPALRFLGWLLSRVTMQNWGWQLAVVCVGFLLPMLGIVLLWIFPQWLQRFPLRWLCGDYYRNAGFMALAHALKHQPDLIGACHATAQLVPLKSVARPYELVAHGLAAGRKPHEAFRNAGLLSRRESAACQLGLDGREPAWCLQQLASWKLERMLRRYSLLVQLLVVLFTLLLACLVGLLAVALFQTLAAMALTLS
jgi:hypothetical protein